MSARDDLEALIKMLEEAREGSMGLSREVARLAGWRRVEPRHCGSKHGAWIAPQDWIGTMSGGRPILDGLHGTDMHREPPDFTSSVDAAMSLVPEGWSWGVSTFPPGEVFNPEGAQAYVTNETGGLHSGYQHGEAQTGPLALCVASLRVRLAEMEESK